MSMIRVLLVEDQEIVRRGLKTLLEIKPDFQVAGEAGNGQQAIAQLAALHAQDQMPDVILMDLHMPVMDGVEATRRIKADAQIAQTVIIALTASAFEEQRQAFLAAGCDDFISKPFQGHILFSKISQHLGVQYQHQAADRDQATLQREPYTSLKPEHMAQTNASKTHSLKTVLATLPEAWRVQLKRAALEGSDSRMFELLEQMPLSQEALKASLIQLAENFQFDQILTLIALADAIGTGDLA